MNRKAHIVFGAGISIFLLTLIGQCSRDWWTSCSTLAFLGGALGGWLPDLDLKFKHRAALHNVFSLLLVPLSLYYASTRLPLDWLSPLATIFSLGVAAGYASHILLDASTSMGVSLFYPFSKKRYRYAQLHSNSRAANQATIVLGLLLLIAGYIIVAKAG